MIFFANILPGLAFSLDLIETTGEYGVNEGGWWVPLYGDVDSSIGIVLLSSFMAAFVFAVFGGQPLCIAGVTGTFPFQTSYKYLGRPQAMIARTHNCVQQDNIHYSARVLQPPDILTLHRMGISLVCDNAPWTRRVQWCAS